MKILVLTGGPCGGKTTILNRLKENTEINAVFAPELATLLHEGKAGFQHVQPTADERLVCWNVNLIRMQMAIETALLTAGELKGADWLICDRAIIDNIAYTPEHLRPTILATVGGWASLDDRYDTVAHLESQAHGSAYSLDNPARYETPEDARRMCRTIYEMWQHVDPRNHLYFRHEDSLDYKCNTIVDVMMGRL